jgi:hypothetical protein
MIPVKSEVAKATRGDVQMRATRRWTATLLVLYLVLLLGGALLLLALAAPSAHGLFTDATRGSAANATTRYGSDWHIEPVDTAGDVDCYTSLALDATDHLHTSYSESYPVYDLKYAFWNGSAWITQTVDTAGYAGEYSSLALDDDGHPHIGYYDTTGDLKYARWDGSAWITQVVDGVGIAGKYTSLALDSSDHPHISYYDGLAYDRSALKYAHWTGSTCPLLQPYHLPRLHRCRPPRRSRPGPRCRLSAAITAG